MAKWLVAAVVGLVALPLVLLVAGMRWKVSPVLNAVRRMNRAVTNPRALKTAGTAGTQTSVLRHTGRRSGRVYETPVDVVATDGGFLIALPYGTRVDWLRNVLDSGSATVITQGRSVDVGSPRIVATEDVSREFPPGTRRTLRLFGVRECVHLERVEP